VDRQETGGQLVIDVGHVDDRMNAFMHQHERQGGQAEARLEAVQVSAVDPDVVPVPIPVQRRLPDPEDVDGVRVVERLQANKQDLGAAA
jgi:hypothetical protein